MKRLFALFLSLARPRLIFAEDDNVVRTMRIAELKWLLSEIAVSPNAATR
jgi:hypothetical protein